MPRADWWGELLHFISEISTNVCTLSSLSCRLCGAGLSAGNPASPLCFLVRTILHLSCVAGAYRKEGSRESREMLGQRDWREGRTEGLEKRKSELKDERGEVQVTSYFL